VRLGISPFASSRPVVERLAARALDGGLGTLWLGDGLLDNPDFPLWSGGLEGFTELAWLAGRFPTARIGLSAVVLPLRNPIWVARQAASLDHLSGGRCTVAVCPGYWEREANFLGVDFATRGQRFEEGIATLRTAWAGESGPPAAQGAPARVAPAPLTPGGPPLWLAGARATMRRALRLGLPFQVSRVTPAELKPMAAEWFGEGGTTLAVRIRAQVGAVVEGAEVAWHALTGTTARLTEGLGELAALGVADVSLLPGQDDASSLATVEALADEVVPALGDLVDRD